MFNYVMLTGLALLAAYWLAHLAWTGRIEFSTRTLLNRRENPMGFWVVWTILVGWTVFIYVFFFIRVAGGPLAR